MINLSLILFALAAVVGLVLLRKFIGNKMIPLWLALVHGAFAAPALIILIIAVSVFGIKIANLPLILFVIAALGGFILFSLHLKKKRMPLSLAIAHAIVAIIAFVILLSRHLRAISS